MRCIKEEWKPVREAGYETFYEVSNLGRVRSLSRQSIGVKGYKYSVTGGIIKSHINGSGYKVLGLRKRGVGKTFLVHRLILKAFVPHVDEDDLHVNHINSNRADNNLGNLEWTTAKENIRHGVECGNIATKSDNYNSLRVKVYDKEENIISVFGSSMEAVEIMGVSRTRLDECLNSEGEKKIFNELIVRRSGLTVEEVPSELLNKPVAKRALLMSRSKPVKITGGLFVSYYSGVRKAQTVNGGRVSFSMNLQFGKDRLIRGKYLIENISQWEYVNLNDSEIDIPLPTDNNGNII